MGVSYEEMLKTPYVVIATDLEMIALENKYSQPAKSDKMK